MTAIVAIPIHRVSARVILEKGRGWSAVDELVLWSLSRAPRSATDIAQKLNVSRRVVLEIIVRMMRFRLVEAVYSDGALVFQATEYGAGVVTSGAQIPTLKRRISRGVSFVVDQITGTVFSRTDVKIDTEHGIRFMQEKGMDVRSIKVSGATLKTSPKENVVRFQKVLREDELLLYFDGDTYVSRPDEYMMVSVDGDDIDGIPARAPNHLIDQIRSVATTSDKARPVVVASQLKSDDDALLPAPVTIDFTSSDLILGGEEHRRAFRDAISRASRRILLHSTFLRKDGFFAWRDEFSSAVRRGATIDIYWGAGTPSKPGEKAILEAANIKSQIAKDELLRDRVRIHLRSTGSHAKLLICDDGEDGYVAIVGSCNWLYTGFDRLELSVALRDPAIVCEVVDNFSSLIARPGFKPEVGAELYALARNLRDRTSFGGSSKVRMIVGQNHEAILRDASGSAMDRFLVASDKFGNSAFPNAIVPSEVAAATSTSMPTVVFGDPTGMLDGKTAAGLSIDVRDRGVRVLRISGGFHAKFLLWGDDDIVVTSLNWCSWSTNPNSPTGEIGVHVNKAGIARDLELRLKLWWPEL